MFDASEASPGFGPGPWHEAPEAPEAAEVVEAEGDASDARRGDTQDMPTDDIYIYYIRMYVRYIYISIYDDICTYIYLYM